MAVISQVITENYAMYNGDCVETLSALPDKSVHLTVYSPPFCGLYNYSSHDQDMSNNDTYDGFLEHYGFLVREISRLTKPGRMTAVHCSDIPNPGQRSGYYDLPGKLIDLHQRNGFHFFGRAFIWKEPLAVAIRTRLKHLTHKNLVADSADSTVAAGDQFLFFKRHGANTEPVTHALGFDRYAGGREVPPELLKYRGEPVQKKNRLSHWIWRQYASCFWDDIRQGRVLPYRQARDPEDEKHVHPLQLDAIERTVMLWSNPGDVVLTPFMGVGSEVYGSIINGRKAIGVELKEGYFRQAVKNVQTATFGEADRADYAPDLFDDGEFPEVDEDAA